MRFWTTLTLLGLVCSIVSAQPPRTDGRSAGGIQGRSQSASQGLRSRALQAGGNLRQPQQRQQTGGVQIRRSNREEQNAARQFTVNAIRFDLNGDGLLGANELQNMFIMLASRQQQSIGPWVNGGYRRQLGRRLLGVGGQTTTTVQTTTNTPIVQGLAVQRAVQIFLQLILSFDANNDGFLSQAELTRFAQALLQNDLSLVNTASQARNRTTTVTTTTQNRSFNRSPNIITGQIPINTPSYRQGPGQTRRPNRGNQGNRPRGRRGTPGSGGPADGGANGPGQSRGGSPNRLN